MLVSKELRAKPGKSKYVVIGPPESRKKLLKEAKESNHEYFGEECQREKRGDRRGKKATKGAIGIAK